MKTILSTALGLVFTASLALAQLYPALPSTYNPSYGIASEHMNGAGVALRASMEAKSKAAELKIQQGWLDLARQQAAQSNQPVSLTTGGGDMQQALLMANMAHSDFAALTPAMQIISVGFQPVWSKITMAEYLESLYVIAKNASFAAQLRDKLLADAALKAVPVPAKP